MIRRATRAGFSALLVVLAGMAQADVKPLTLKAPIPNIGHALPELPRHDVWMAAQTETVSHKRGADLHPIGLQALVSAFGFPCKTDVSLTTLPGAMLKLAIIAPCKPGMGVAVTHAGLPLDLKLSQTGSKTLSIPALDEQAQMEILFDDGTVIKRSTRVPDLSGFLRVALQSNGADALYLSGTAPAGVPLRNLVVGGSNGRMLQVISHPLDPERRAGVIRLTLQTNVTAADCDRGRQAQVLGYAPDRPPLTYTLALAAPGCNHVGEILELKNVVQDLKLATH